MGDFERDEVLYFMISKGGRVRNHELVTHFKNFLNHPNDKVINRNKFKDFVNDLATIKLDETGEKVLVLKKKYRPEANTFGSQSSVASSTSSLSVSASTSLSSLCKTPSATPTPASSEPDLSPQRSSREDELSAGSPLKQDEPSQNDSPRAQSEPPRATMTSTPQSSHTAPTDSVDGGGVSRMRSDENVDVRLRRTDRPDAKDNSVSGSTASIASTESQKSHGSSTSGVASMDDDQNSSVISVKDKIKNLNKITSDSDLTNLNRINQKKNVKYGDDDDASQSSGMSYVNLTPEQKEWMIVCSGSEYHEMNRLLSKNLSLARVKDLTNTALHWAAKSGKAEVIKLVANKPGVNVDQRSGYTALHLAALHGHEHIIELLVQVFKADADLRDYSGKKAKQYLMNSASSKAQQLLVSRRLGSDLHPGKQSLDDSFMRSTSMRMSNRAKAMSSLLQVKSAIARQPFVRSSWGGSAEDVSDENNRRQRSRTPPGSGGSSPRSLRQKRPSKDMDLMPPPSNSMMARRMRYSDRSKSSSRESLSSPSMRRKMNDENQNMMRSESDPSMVEGHTEV